MEQILCHAGEGGSGGVKGGGGEGEEGWVSGRGGNGLFIGCW